MEGAVVPKLELITAKRKNEPFILLETYGYMPSKALPSNKEKCDLYTLSYDCFPMKRKTPVAAVPESCAYVAPYVTLPTAQLSLQQLALAAVLFPLICADAIKKYPRGGFTLRQLLTNSRYTTVRAAFESYMGSQLGICPNMIDAYSRAISESTPLLVDQTHVYYVQADLMQIKVRFLFVE